MILRNCFSLYCPTAVYVYIYNNVYMYIYIFIFRQMERIAFLALFIFLSPAGVGTLMACRTVRMYFHEERVIVAVNFNIHEI